jgi:hypothetical protein
MEEHGAARRALPLELYFLERDLVLAGEARVSLQARADPPAGDFCRQYTAVDEAAQA